MDTLHMLNTAAVLFGIAALGGVAMAIIRFRGADRPPSSFAMLHGLLAGAGLTLLLYAAATTGVPGLVTGAIVLFVIAALAGIWLNLSFHSKLLALPKGPILIHGAVAAAGFVLLLLALQGA